MTENRAVPIIVATHDLTDGKRMSKILAGSMRMNVVAITANLMETFSAVEDHAPKIVIIAEEMTRFEEFSVMLGLFDAMQIKWVAMTKSMAKAAGPGRNSPSSKSGLFSLDLSATEDRILEQVSSLAHIPMHHELGRPSRKAHSQHPFGKIVMIGCSTGGVDALVQVLRHFPRACPPTFVVQHTGVGYGESLARLLAKQCTPDVKIATDGETIGPGMICIGAGMTKHLTVTPPPHATVTLQQKPPVSGHRPSIDVLFESAVPWANLVVAALLTGMGRDGAKGLLALKNSGAMTIGQDEATSIVYGMPRAAAEMGAVTTQLPLSQIGPTLLQAASDTGRIIQ